MEALTIDLPPAMKAFVQEQVEGGGYGTTSEYIRRLIREDQQRRQREIIDCQLLEALDSGPATPWTKEDLDALKQRVRERHS